MKKNIIINYVFFLLLIEKRLLHLFQEIEDKKLYEENKMKIDKLIFINEKNM